MPEITKKIIIRNKYGLHARPAAMFVQIANRYESEISVKNKNEEVNGKSIMGIMMLAANCGTEIEITVSGKDAEAAVAELEKLLLTDSDK